MFSKRKSVGSVSPDASPVPCGKPSSSMHHRWKKWLTPRFLPSKTSSGARRGSASVSLSVPDYPPMDASRLPTAVKHAAPYTHYDPQSLSLYPSVTIRHYHRWTMDMANDYLGSPMPPPPRNAKQRYQPPPTMGTTLLSIPEIDPQ